MGVRFDSKLVLHSAMALVCSLLLVWAVFFHFPLLGHDYSMFMGAINDYHFAWKKFGVFDFEFSPQRCLGVPVKASPLGAHYSLAHVLALLTGDIGVTVSLIVIHTCLAYWGCIKFLTLMGVQERWKGYLASAWVLQGFIFYHVVVGHVGFIAVGMWPLYLFLLLNRSTRVKELLTGVLVGLFLAHDFHSSLTYLYIMFPLSLACLLLFLKINKVQMDLKNVLLRLSIGLSISVVLIVPRILDVLEFTRFYQREVRFDEIPLVRAFEYALMSYVFPIPLNYQKMTGWWYGNWESIISLFSGVVLLAFIFSVAKFKENKSTAYSLLGVLVLGTFISSGIYADVVGITPVIKSLHVNPRWMVILAPSILLTVALFLNRSNVKKWFVWSCLGVQLLMNFYSLDVDTLLINYPYRNGYNPETNRLDFCYEPVFGHGLELFPIDKVEEGKWLDPRCYLTDKCKSFVLPDDKLQELLEYRLKKFEN